MATKTITNSKRKFRRKKITPPPLQNTPKGSNQRKNLSIINIIFIIIKGFLLGSCSSIVFSTIIKDISIPILTIILGFLGSFVIYLIDVKDLINKN